MKNLIQNLILALVTAVIFVLPSPPARAQTAGIYTIGPWNAGTNVVAAATTNTVAPAIACSEYDNVGVQVSLKCTASTSGNAILRIFYSLDSTTYETTPTSTLLIPLNGTTAVCSVQNLSIPSAGTLQFGALENTNASAIFTNVSVKVRFKAVKKKNS
jgi:hypothetical protein